MIGYIIRRLAALVPILIGVSIIVFALTRLMPGNIAMIMLGPNADPEQIASLEHEYGLDKPELEQFTDWISGAVRGDLGRSFLRDRPVADEILDRLPVTGQLLIMTVMVSATLGIMNGMLSAAFHRRFIDNALRVVSIVGMSVPTFWVATLVILLPSLWFAYAPPFSAVGLLENPWDNLRQFGPPALVLGFASSCGLSRVVRGSILGVLNQDFMRTARAKGLGEATILRRHALGNVMLPIITVIGMEMAVLMGGAIIVEQVFNLSGLGRLFIESASTRDYPVIQAMTLYTATIFVTLSLLVDLAYAWLDPRVRLTGGRSA